MFPCTSEVTPRATSTSHTRSFEGRRVEYQPRPSIAVTAASAQSDRARPCTQNVPSASVTSAMTEISARRSGPSNWNHSAIVSSARPGSRTSS